MSPRAEFVRPLACSVLLLAALLPAQETTPTAAPAESRLLYTVEVQGPAAWRAMFGVTNVGSFLGSEKGQAIAQQVIRPLEFTVQKASGLEDKAYALARERLLEYGGSIVVEVRTFAGGSDSIGALIAMSPDGRTDLAALAADLSSLLAKLDGAEWKDEPELGGNALRMLHGFVTTAPVAVGADPEKACVTAAMVPPGFALRARAEARALGERIAARGRRMRPCLHVDLDVQGSMALSDVRDADLWAKSVGLDTLRHLELSVGAAGPHVMLEAAQQFEGEARGLFGILFPDVQTLPKVGALRPKDATVWKVGHCDLAAIERTIREGAKAAGTENRLDDGLPKPVFDAKEGVLAHFTGEYAMFATPREIDELERGDFAFGMLFRVRDHEAFATKWKAARKELGFTELEAETLDGGYVLQRLGGFFQVHCAIGPDLFAIAYGRGVDDMLRAAVATAEEHGFVSKEPTLALPSHLQRFAPKGCNGLAEGDVAVVAAQVLWAAGLVLSFGAFDLPLSDLPEIDAEAMREVLKEYRLDVARSATGYDQGRWNLRVYW